MRRIALALALASLATAAYARGNHYGSHVRSDADRCSADDIQFDDGDTYVEKQVIDAGTLRSLKIAGDRSPISVTGGSGSGYTVTVCKAANSPEKLRDINVSVVGGEVKTSGPSSTHNWTVLYHITVPRGANVDVSTENGPLALSDVDGTVVARAENGPLSLANVSGEVDAQTINGPISIDGGAGRMTVKASNGPLSIALDGDGWNGSLEASTKNGPLSISVPRNFNSGVVVESDGRGPISCRAEGCDRGWRMTRDGGDDGDEPRRIELGHGATAVHATTVNGPITIRDTQ
ncbi:MAG: DUF4097 family beta strand repeat protein [Acidobacteria bacterium]|nr:DUF4097 family beta strand repeat protein [Acidobacteriota bacterium]MBV9478372.1 DUF4097 family beta strand repeat protein [Acidobacteriota bacterium]